jgi:hypothetical protein
MKSLTEVRGTLTELFDVRSGISASKLQQLVRVGLIDPSQFTRLKRALSKEDFTRLTRQERDLLLDTFHRLLDHIISNQQLFQRTKSVYAAEELETHDAAHERLTREGWKRKKSSEPVYEKDGKTKTLLVKDGRVVKTFGEAKETYVDDPSSQRDINFSLPVMIVLKRKAIRTFPDRKKVGLYFSDKLKRYFSIPSTGDALSEEMDTIELSEASNSGNVFDMLKAIAENREPTRVTFADGSTMKVSFVTAHAMMCVYNRLEDPHNKVKFEKMVNKDRPSFMKMLDFTNRHHK